MQAIEPSDFRSEKNHCRYRESFAIGKLVFASEIAKGIQSVAHDFQFNVSGRFLEIPSTKMISSSESSTNRKVLTFSPVGKRHP